jgi:hypothetical protein
MFKKLGVVAATVLTFSVLPPRGAEATCTVSFTCSNACSAHTECSTGIVLNCLAPNEVITCSGNTTCTIGSNSVTCDGQTQACQPKTTRCRSTSDSVLCGNTFKACPTCGGRICKASPASEPDLFGPAEPAVADVEAAVAAAF